MKNSVISKGKLLDLSTPKVMAIVNITPDSFFSGSRVDESTALITMERLLNDGADLLDLGAYSTRPGALEISIQEELDRLMPVLELGIKHHPEVWFSVDTFRSEVAQEACRAGAKLINDVSGGLLDPHIMTVAAREKVPYILMHMRGNPQNMQTKAKYGQVTEEVIEELSRQVTLASQAGIQELILDPGFGFAKTWEQGYQLIRDFDAFTLFEKPILVGVSRKSMLYKPLGSTPEDILPATSALHMALLNKGAHILRVHDPKEACQVIKLREWIHK